MSEWGDLNADVRHAHQEKDEDLGEQLERDREAEAEDEDREETITDSDTEPLDGVGRLIARWGSWRYYKGRDYKDRE